MPPQIVKAAPRCDASLVVIEFGGAWPQWLSPSRSGDMAVVAQHYEGAPSSLITQVASRMTRLTSGGWRIQSVVLVSNGRTDPEATSARSVLARGLLSHLKEMQGGRLVLTVGQAAGQRAAHNLMALAAALDQGLEGIGVGLMVRIGRGLPLYGSSQVTPAFASAS